MLVLTWIRKLYKVLSADASPAAIAFGAAFGILLGCLPLNSGLAMLLIASILAIRVQLSSAIAAFLLAKGLSKLGLEAVYYSVGEALLEAEALKGFWTWFLNLPVIAWLDLNRLLVTGAAICGLLAGAALFQPIRLLVAGYRRYLHERASQNRFFKWLTSFWLTKLLRFIFLGVEVAK